MNRKNSLYTLSFLILIELVVTLFFNKITNKDTYSIVYFLVGILIAINVSVFPKGNKALTIPKIKAAYLIVPQLLVFAFFLYHINLLFQANPINYKIADMLPVIKKMSERFVSGEKVYLEIPEIWDGMKPIYLPMMFLPFSIGVLLDIDIRWVGIALMLIGIFLMIFNSKPKSALNILVLFFTSFFLVESLYHGNTMWYAHSQEPLIYGYYLILGYAGLNNKKWLILFAIISCLMSRYVLIFWVPFYISIIYLNSEKHKALALLLLIPAICCLLMWITGAFENLDVFVKTPQNYLININVQWRYESFRDSLGLLKFVPLEKVKYLYGLNLALMAIIPIVSLIVYYKYPRLFSSRLFPFAVLKLSLVFFYNLLVMPYFYLFVMSTLFSILLLSGYIKEYYDEPQRVLSSNKFLKQIAIN